MTRPMTRRLTTRSQLDPRTTFDSTTPNLDVVARPINAPLKQDVSSKANQLAQALGIFGEGVQGTVKGFQDRFNHEMEEGMFLAQKGDEKPSQGEYLIKGYETMEGELHARKFAREAKQYYFENYNKLDPEEFNEGLKSLSEQYLEQAPSDNYLKSFIPVATQAEGELISRYNSDMAKEFQLQSLNMTSELIADELDLTVQNTLGTSLEGILDRPEDYLRTAIGIGESEIGQTLRQTLTEMQVRGEALNLDKQTVSNLFVKQVGQLAVDTGMPELLDFASIEDSDKIRLETNPALMESIETYRKKAEGNRNSIIQMQDKEIQKQKEAEFREKKQLFTATLGNLQFMKADERLATANEMEDLLLNDEAFDTLSDSQFRTYHDRLMDVKAGINKFADEPDWGTFVTLYHQAESGLLDVSDLIEVAPELDRSSYELFAGMIKDYNDSLLNEREDGLSKTTTESKKRANEYFHSLMPRIVAQLRESKGYQAQFEGDTDDAMEGRMILDYIALTEEKGAPLTLKEIEEHIFNPYIEAETKYFSTDEFLSGEALSTKADTNPRENINSGAEVVNEAKERGNDWFRTPEDYLPEGFKLDSYSPERQQKGIQAIQAVTAENNLTYDEVEKELLNSQAFGDTPQEAKDYLRAYYYMNVLNQIEGAVTGRTIINVQENLRDQGVPEDLIKNIIMDLE